MKIKCEYCGSFIDDTDEKCQFCGAVNSHLVRKATGIPETIEELIAFAKEHNLPLKEMRYFLNENYTGPKAIGIYKDEETENFIVYKNKTDGTRAVRYEGKDEKYAVNEIYQKMKTDLIKQKEHKAQSPPPRNNNNQKNSGGLTNILVWVMIIIIIVVILGGKRACGSLLNTGSDYDSVPGYSSGYDYDYDDGDSGSWWSSDDDDSWSSNYNSSWNDNWNSSNWDWGSNSWNSGGSNWNSNW
ncbi:MAG: hypothetical protein K5649_02310 [Lachnospiraceae bacterium]|nr:hypothetical protein [Lachnospiraceae bacterium]